MNKREFLKASGVALAGTLLSRVMPAEQQAGAARTNWAGNITYSADRLVTPTSVDEVRQAVKGGGGLKALGTRHSFNRIADAKQEQISLQHLEGMDLDAKAHTVTVGAGVRYGQLAPYLDQHGYALHNLASLPHISVAGACATGTHGSGNRNGNLSTSVRGMELVKANGEVVQLWRERDGERFRGAVVGLGALGVVTKITLDVEPTFQMRQVVYENLPMAELKGRLEEVFASGYSVSLFTDWQGHRMTQVWIKSRVDKAAPAEVSPEFFGARLATRNLHPLAGHSAENCTEQMGVAGPWYERMPHFRMNFTPSSGAELQSEYFVPRERGYEAMLAVEQLRDQVTPHLQISELRTVEADELWMSPCYRRASMTIHFTWRPEWEAVQRVLPRIEEKLAPFDARPHWAKLFTMPPERLHRLYPEMPQFLALAKEYDPQGKFRNEFLLRNVYPAGV